MDVESRLDTGNQVVVGQLRGLTERGRQARRVGGRGGGTRANNVTHWVSLWDVIDPFLLLTGGNLHNRADGVREQPREPVTSGFIKQSNSLHITGTARRHTEETLRNPINHWSCVCV